LSKEALASRSRH